MKAYQAYAAGCRVTEASPRAAAAAFFEKFPAKRKCDVIEGDADGESFVVVFGRVRPMSFKNVSKKMVGELPEVV